MRKSTGFNFGIGLVAVLASLSTIPTAAAAADNTAGRGAAPKVAPPAGPGSAARPVKAARPPGEPLERVKELIGWIAREQRRDGSWTHVVHLPLGFHIHTGVKSPGWFEDKADVYWSSSVADTAMAGLALLRAEHPAGGRRSAHHRHVVAAADFLYDRVMKSDAATLGVQFRPSPLTDRIGPHVDGFLALLFFLELRDPQSPDPRYEPTVRKLLDKIQKGQLRDGSWARGVDEANHAPLLGHALGVWALASAVRQGLEVDPRVLDGAVKFAMSPDADRREAKAVGRWKTANRVIRPAWVVKNGAADEEPGNSSMYAAAARLSILYQADLTNRWRLRPSGGQSAPSRAPTTDADAAPPQRPADQRPTAAETAKALADFRNVVRKSWAKLHERDLHPCPGPLQFNGEDFLASLLIVDSMAECRDVEQWFPPVVQRLMTFQSLDGGLRSDRHIDCLHDRLRFVSFQNRCEQPFTPWPDTPVSFLGGGAKIRRPSSGGEDEPTVRKFVEPEHCKWQLSWCSKDRVFATSAGLMTLLADTPYRAAFLGLDRQQPVSPVGAGAE